MQLPSFVQSRSTGGNAERKGKSARLFQRIAWTLRRTKAATRLCISIHTPPVLSYSLHEREDWATILPEMQAAMKASQDLPNIQALKWDVHLPAHVDYQAVRPEYVPQCQMWQKQLLLAAPNITVLSLGPHVSRAPALGNLPLRHLELVIEKEQPWLVGFLQDLRHVTTLESLTVLSQASQGAVPNLRLRSSLKNLRHIRLQNLLPTQEFSLPEDCLLHLKAHYYSPQWSQGIARHTAVIDLRPFSLSAWPADIWYFSKLQCLMMEMPSMQLTKNINAFLRGTKAFTFDFISRDGEAEAVSASGVVRSACQKNDVQYFDCSATAVSTSEQAVQAYTKHADKLCRSPSPAQLGMARVMFADRREQNVRMRT
ncbi:g1650 [Coccomyxa viridis]|uniref:G1650 protein n=1 Tax=Coccomyxa viridis TaxID=1274662 RepID=A0ABP1FMB9_9CHLO